MEKFAIDLDAVLDEFELHEDQAEAAAQIQQIDVSPLDGVSSATVSSAAYDQLSEVFSNRSAVAHGHSSHACGYVEPRTCLDPVVDGASCPSSDITSITADGTGIAQSVPDVISDSVNSFTSSSKSAYSGEVQQSKSAYSGEVQQSKSAYSGEVQQSKSAYSGEVQQSTSYSGEVQEPKSAYSGEVQEPKSAYSGEVQQSTSYSGEVQEPKSAYSGELQEPKSAYSGEVQQSKPAYSGEVHQPKSAYSGEVQEPKSAYSGEVQQPKSAYSGEVQEPKSAYSGEVQEPKSAYSGEVQQPKSTYSGEVQQSDRGLKDDANNVTNICVCSAEVSQNNVLQPSTVPAYLNSSVTGVESRHVPVHTHLESVVSTAAVSSSAASVPVGVTMQAVQVDEDGSARSSPLHSPVRESEKTFKSAVVSSVASDSAMMTDPSVYVGSISQPEASVSGSEDMDPVTSGISSTVELSSGATSLDVSDNTSLPRPAADGVSSGTNTRDLYRIEYTTQDSPDELDPSANAADVGSQDTGQPLEFRAATLGDVSDDELERCLQSLEDESVSAGPSHGPEYGRSSPAAPSTAVVSTSPGSTMARLQTHASIECEVRRHGSISPPARLLRPSSLDVAPRNPALVTSVAANSSHDSEEAQHDTAASGSHDGGETQHDTTASGSHDSEERPQNTAAASDDTTESGRGSELCRSADVSAQDGCTVTGGNVVTAPGAEQLARLSAPQAPGAPPRGQLVSLSDEDRNLGKVAPVWVPDEESGSCMSCDTRFTVIRRRHHCRACGRVLCGGCCGERARLEYMESREARVCDRCKAILDRVQQGVRIVPASGNHQQGSPGRVPNPNNPDEYCSRVPPVQQADSAMPPPAVLVPSGVLRRPGDATPRTPGGSKQVIFSDGIRPGGDLTELTGSSAAGATASSTLSPTRRQTRVSSSRTTPTHGVTRPRGAVAAVRAAVDRTWNPESDQLPPLIQAGSLGCVEKDSIPEESMALAMLDDETGQWSFQVNRNLVVDAKITKLDCCVGSTCWIFCSRGLCAVGQDEVMVILEYIQDERSLPRDVFIYYHRLFMDAAAGSFASDLGHTLFTGSFLGSKEHGGFLYVRPTFQCLQTLPSPPQPFLVALLIHKWEVPWAKVFPLRLLLRLGAEFHYYPCPLVSVRFRKTVFFEVGHTIINLLADFRNYAYILPGIHGMYIHMEDRQTSVLIPRNRYNQVLKTINNSNDHVLAFGTSFSRTADSHLVCIQSEHGDYQTQAITIHNRPRQVTGASFIVFNGALKSSLGLTAKSSIVEDGLMFQISPDCMTSLRDKLRQMQDFSVECGPLGGPAEETVHIRWVQDDRSHNIGVTSVIDGRVLDGVVSVKVHAGTDYMSDGKLIRWTEVFLIRVDEPARMTTGEPPEFSRLAEALSRGTCVALVSLLNQLCEESRTPVALRATIDADTVCYEAGSNCEPLPSGCLNLLDSELVPVLHRYAADAQDHPICLELLFHILDAV